MSLCIVLQQKYPELALEISEKLRHCVSTGGGLAGFYPLGH